MLGYVYKNKNVVKTVKTCFARNKVDKWKIKNPNFVFQTALETQLISIRNVEVVNFKNRGIGNTASTPFYLQVKMGEKIKHFKNLI